jgi:arylsulfatase A
LGLAGAEVATTIFDAAASNTTGVANDGVLGSGAGDSATGDLVWTGPSANFNNGGFASTCDINALLGTPLTTADTVTVKLDVTSLVGTLRANGITFGVHDSATWADKDNGATAGSMIVNLNSSDTAGVIDIWETSFQDAGPTAYSTGGDAALADGFALTLEADVDGYTFTLDSVAASTIVLDGTFAGTEFVDNFGSSHFYYTAQRFNTGGGLVSTIGEASIAVASPPEVPGVYTNARPNVIMIYYDDMGYSDMGAYSSTQSSFTPNLDSFAAGALRFTAGHSADAVCTPSRYALMTGRYCWRTSKKTGVNGGYTPSLVEDDRFTFAKMFQSLGYKTAMVGKWHIGMQFYDPAGAPIGDLDNNSNVLDNDASTTTGDLIDFSHALSDTPFHQGFDYYFGTTASLDMPPYAWIENDTVLFKGGLVTGGGVDFSQAVPATNADFLEGSPITSANTTGSSRNGVYDPTFVMSDYLQVQAAKVAEIIKARGADGEPFYMYIPMPAPHNPWALQDAFTNVTSFSYGNYLAQTDFYTGQILDALADPDGNPLTEDSLVNDTVVFISSDNGLERAAQTASLSAGHDGNGAYRGVKRDNWEGGTRVPYLVRWPGMVTPGTSDFACWQGDFYASMAEYLRYDLNPEEAPDAESFLPVLMGESMPIARREGFVQHSMLGQLAIVDKNGEWKLLDGTGSGGYTATYDADNNYISGVGGTVFGSPKQLFNLLADPGERTNRLLSATQADLDKEAELYALLNEIRGNTTYGTDGDSSVPPIDSDEDGLPNYYEGLHSGLDRDNPADADDDFEPDGLDNLEEYQLQTDPNDPDSDDDRLTDGEEVHTYGTLPNNAQSDSDSLPDGDEVLIWATNPLLADSDADGVDDDVELLAFSNPRNGLVTPMGGSNSVVVLSPSVVQLAGANGTVNDPQVLGDASSGWTEAGSLFVRERDVTDPELRTRLFLKFDLTGLEGIVSSARLRIHQNDRLNTLYSSDLQLARVTEPWEAVSGSYPLFDTTPVADAFLFGSNSDFGSAVAASGFYSGTPGVAGSDDSGFDLDGAVTAMVAGWIDGSTSNYGFRVAATDRAYAAAAFSAVDDAATTDVDEELQLIVTVQSEWISLDADGDGMLDSQEFFYFGNLTRDGTGDFDEDGVADRLEMALGSDPKLGSALPDMTLVTTNASSIAYSYHRYNQAALGYEVLVSEDLTNWNSYTEYYYVADPALVSELGEEYDNVLLEPHATTPDQLFYKLNIHSK